ncbi:hypothetical protein [Sphingomonas sp. G-3-2-10]|uniref:hypothetical protein n=1 Tax=Sphingomonas sp. G-3-2-10 TaxID=2728838 RepID=UPI00146F8D1F|nr:hypothetical protein [Sphingomonas sp. G-3-2-10]NML04518.1 hypothetical protein [Sphingomonas sp. G-3-2-10]
MAALASTSPASAQDSAAAPASVAAAPATEPTPAGCELHVWPGSDLIHLYYGWVHGGTINGSTKGREGYPEAPENPLTAEVQGHLLAGMNLPKLVALPDYAVIVHPQPLSSREIRASKTRLATSNSPCYAELMVDDLLLTQNVIGGNALRASFRFRDFGPDAAPRRMFGSFAMTKLLQFPPKAPDNMPAAAEELRKAFESNVAQFAAALTKPPKRK